MRTNNLDSKIQVIVFGLDETGKPRAGRFSAKEAEAAKEAAASAKLTLWETTASTTDGFIKEIPVGRIHGKGSAIIPYVKQALYDQLVAAATKASETEPTASALAQSLARAKAEHASALPASWDAIAPGHAVLYMELAGDGFYEAIVVKREDEHLTLRFRDFPKHQTIHTHIRSVALMYPGL
jgi:hypothetical protein